MYSEMLKRGSPVNNYSTSVSSERQVKALQKEIGRLKTELDRQRKENRRAEACLAKAEASLRHQRRVAALKERKAKEREEILKTLMDFIPVGIAVTEPDQSIRMTSRYGRRLAGLPDEVLMNSDSYNLSRTWGIYDKDERPARDEDLPSTRVIRNGEVVTNEEWNFRRPDGTFIPVLVNACPIRDRNGIIVAGITAWRDISDLKDALQKLNRSKETAEHNLAQMHAIFESLSEGLIFMDDEGNFIDFNPAAKRIFDFATPVEIHRNIQEMEKELQFCTLDGVPLPSSERPFSQVLQGEQLSGREILVRNRRKKRNKVLSFSGTQVHGTRSRQILSLMAFHDITPSVTASLKLQESESRFRLLAESAPIGVFECDGEGRYTYVNSQWQIISGQTPEESFGFGWLQAVHPEDRDTIQREWLFSALENRPFEYRLPMFDGTIKWVRVKARILKRNESLPMKFVGTIEDITERKKTEEAMRRAVEAAEEANRAKSDFIANISHEFRTPMTVFMGALELAMQTELNPEQYEYLQMAEESADSLLVLIDDLLDFSELGSGKMAMKAIPFALKENLQKTLKTFLPKTEQKSLSLELEISPEVPEVIVGDPERIRQVLSNILGNAIKFTERGEIRIRVDLLLDSELSSIPRLHFSISDTGIGIPPEKLHQLFQTFTQVDSSTTRKYGGAGIGLALSKGLVQTMGGTIWVESEEQKGSTFHFTLPYGSVVSEGGTARYSAEPGQDGLPATILLIEDDPMISRMVKIMLEERDWNVTTAPDGESGLDLWSSGEFDLVLMDIQMPRMDGFEATRRIRKQERERGSHTPIIALTAYAGNEDEKKSLAAGMDDYLSKPLHMERLYAVLEKYLGRENTDASCKLKMPWT